MQVISIAILASLLHFSQSFVSNGVRRQVSIGKDTHSLMNSRNFHNSPTQLEMNNKSSNNEQDPNNSIEPKYLAALGVFFLAALYDFFVMHNGQPFWAQPTL